MSDKTSTLNVEYSKYSTGTEYSWYDDEYLYFGRDSSGSFWMSKICFNTNGLNFKQSKKINIVLTTCQTSNPYGTSALITTSELSPRQIHDLTTDAKAQAVSGYIAHFDATQETNSNVSSDTVIYYPLDTDKLKPNTTYYLYFKRWIGWTNGTSGTNGWTACYSPAYSSNSYIELTYETGGYVNIHDGTGFKKYSVYIHTDGTYKRYAPYVYKGSKWVPCN